MSAITAVTFDLWQTLILDNRELGLQRAQVRLDGAQRLLAGQGAEYDAEHIREAYRGCYRACRAVRSEHRDVSFRQQVEIFINLIEDGLAARLSESVVAEIERVYAESFFEYPPRFHDATHSTLADFDTGQPGAGAATGASAAGRRAASAGRAGRRV